MATQWKVGDRVALKSGGLDMTVTQVGASDGVPTVWVAWFDKDQKPERGFFPSDAVQAA